MKIKNLKYKQFISSPWLCFSILCILTILAYSNTFKVPFIFDDADNIVKNPYVRFNEISWKHISNLPKSLNGKRPVSLFSFGVNYYIDKYNVIGYHIVNLIIHLLNGLILFFLIQKTLSFVSSLRSPNANSSRMDRNVNIKNTRNLLFSKCDVTKPLNKTYLRSENASYLIAFFATALWLLNPVQIFSVTYIIQRMNSLSAMFSLLCLLCYILARTRTHPSTADDESKQSSEDRGQTTDAAITGPLHHRTTAPPHHSITASPHHRTTTALQHSITLLFAVFSLLFAILAIASKQNAVLLPLFVLLYEFYFFQDLRFQWIKKCWKRKILFLTGLIGISFCIVGLGYIVYYNTASNPWKHILSLYNGRSFTPLERMLTQPRVVLYYLSLLFYPNPSRMALLVEIKKSSGLLHPVSTLISISFLFFLFTTALITARKYRILSFSILWFFIGLSLESSIIPLELVYIHRNYLPSMFLFLPIVCGLFVLSSLRSPLLHGSIPVFQQNRFKFFAFLLTGIILLFSYWTYDYNRVWGNSISFWSDNVTKFPNLARPHINLGVALYKQKRLADAEKHFKLGLKIKPDDPRALYNLGVVYEDEKKYDDAIKSYSGALRLNRRFGDAWSSQGNLLVELGDMKNGLNCLYQAWELQPFDVQTNFNLGSALLKNQNYKGVIFHMKRVLQEDPTYTDAYLNLGITFMMINATELAKKYFIKAKELDSENKLANDYLKISGMLKEKKPVRRGEK